MKTAVEWLQELYDSRPAYEEFLLDEEFEQAKQMEKQQIINACWYGHDIKHEYFNPIHYIDKTYPQNK
jgi:hypothetical protein